MKKFLNPARILLSAMAIFTIFSVSPAMAASKPELVSPSTVHNPISTPIANKDRGNKTMASPNASEAWTVSLTTSSNDLWPMQYATLTATANQDVGPTPFYLSIYDETSASYMAICASGTTCTAYVTQSQPTTHFYESFVSYYPPSTGTPSGVQATSNVVYVLWHGVNVTLTTSQSTLALGASATFTATTSSDVGPSPFWIEIFDATTGTRIAVCGFGTSCSATASQSVATTHKFIAYVSSYSLALPPANTIATSSPVFVTWTAGNYRISLVGNSVYNTENLTAYANQDVGPTPYWIEIFNLDTGALVKVCGTGLVCSASTTMQYGANHYTAFISSYSSSLPPAGTQATSNEITSYFYPIP